MTLPSTTTTATPESAASGDGGDGGSGRAGRAGLVGRAVGAWPAQVLARYLASRVLLVVAVVVVTLRSGLDPTGRNVDPVDWLFGRFVWLDAFHYLRIARIGYTTECCDQAFLPGYPTAIRLVAAVTGDAVVAGLAISLVAGGVAALLLYRLAGEHRVGLHAVGYLSVAPAGVFLSAIYTEALFLALALGAWLLARSGRWWWAGLLASAACVVRVNGLFLVAGLVVMLLLQRGWAAFRREAWALALPGVALAGVVILLHSVTGSWTAWQDAEERGWGRGHAWPWQGLGAAWLNIGRTADPHLRMIRISEFVVVILGLLLLAVLARRRLWPEATYLVLNLAVLICSTTMVSAPRYALVWFPGYLLVAEYTARPGRRWLHLVVVAVCAALFVLLGAWFTQRRLPM